MNITVAKQRTFVPEFNGNRSLSAEEQIAIVYEIPSLDVKTRLMPKPKLKFRYDSDGRVEGGDTEVSSDRKPIITTMVKSVRNCLYSDDKGEHRITNGKELLECPVEYEPLVDEVEKELRKELERKLDEKN